MYNMWQSDYADVAEWITAHDIKEAEERDQECH